MTKKKQPQLVLRIKNKVLRFGRGSIQFARRFVYILGITVLISALLSMLLNNFLDQIGGQSSQPDGTVDIIALVSSGVAAICSSVLVLHGFDKEEKAVRHQNEIEEAQFILEFNQAFITDDALVNFEHEIQEFWLKKTYTGCDAFCLSHRQQMINYLVYHEGLAPIVLKGILPICDIDDLMGYRFFLAMNNPSIQALELRGYPEYYRGCFKLYKQWKAHRVRHGYPILQEEYGLDKWPFFDLFASDYDVRGVRPEDDYQQIAKLVFRDKQCKKSMNYFRNPCFRGKICKCSASDIASAENIFIATKGDSIIGAAVLMSIDTLTENSAIYVPCVGAIKNNRNEIIKFLVSAVLWRNKASKVYIDVLKSDVDMLDVCRELSFKELEPNEESVSLYNSEDYVHFVWGQKKYTVRPSVAVVKEKRKQNQQKWIGA